MQRQLEFLQLQALVQGPAAAAMQAPQAVDTAKNPVHFAHDDSATGRTDDAEIQMTNVRRRRKPASRRSYIKISFASWLTGKTWLLASRRAESGWDVSLRTLYMVPYNAPIFHACRRGDLPEVRRLLTSGEASILDTISRHRDYELGIETPLEVS